MWLYNLWQWTWGFFQTAAGGILYLKLRKNKHYRYHGACVTLWDRPTSLSLGRFIFLGGTMEEDLWLVKHEYGHSIQSLILGPLFLLVVGLPSVLWCNLPGMDEWRKKKNISYYDFFCEKNANYLGDRFS